MFEQVKGLAACELNSKATVRDCNAMMLLLYKVLALFAVLATGPKADA